MMNKRIIFLSFDEIHIKPELQYQKKHVFENALNASVPTSGNFMLAVMGNPSYGTPAVIACLVPVKILTAEFLHDVVNSVLEIVHSAGGHVFSLMCDSSLVNKKSNKMFHEKFDSLGVTLIVHPHTNLKS